MQSSCELIYVHQGLCGWTYAFNDSLKKLLSKIETNIPLQLLTADVPPHQLEQQHQAFIDLCKGAHKQRDQLSDIKIGEKFSQNILSDSFKGCDGVELSKAIVAIQKYYPSRALESLIFFQHKFFVEGKNLSDNSAYLGWFYELGMDGEYLFYFMNSTLVEMTRKKNQDFILSLGITSYPMLLLKNNNRLHIISKGYMPFEIMEQSIKEILGKVEA
ncbi:MAG: hypothetical protein ACOVOO_01530 [Flavobacteriales bacterium]